MVAEGTFSMSGTDAVDKYTKMLTSFCDGKIMRRFGNSVHCLVCNGCLCGCGCGCTAESIESTVDKATFVEVLTTNGVGGGKETEHFEVFADNAFSDHSAEGKAPGHDSYNMLCTGQHLAVIFVCFVLFGTYCRLVVVQMNLPGGVGGRNGSILETTASA